MNQSPQIQSRINAIAKELANGKDRDTIVSIYGKRWQTSARTVDRYIKKAKPIAKQLSLKADRAMEQTMVEEVTEAAKKGLKAVIEIDTKLQEIIFKPYQLIRDGNKVVKVENTTADQIRAIDIYYKRHGHYETDNKQRQTTIKVSRK